MRRSLFVFLTLVALSMVGDHAVLAQNAQSINDNCDPDRRKDNPNLQAAKEAKKAELRERGYPERFLKLIDREECIACVRQATASFKIMVAYKDNDYAPTDRKTGNHWTHVTYLWDPASEVIAREKTKDGTIKGFFIFNTATKGCLCCPEFGQAVGPESFSDWDEENGINKDHVIPFDQSNLGPLPDDLVNPSDKWVGDPIPNIEVFQKPAKRQAQAPCKACEGETARLNAAYDALDALWDQKIEQLDAQQRQEIEHAARENEIRLLWYKQQSATMRSDANAARIAELEAINQRVMDEMRARVDVIESFDARIAAQQQNIAALERAAAACAERCTTETNAPREVAKVPNVPNVPPPPPPPAPARRETPPAPPAGDSPVPFDLKAMCEKCETALILAQSAYASLQAAERERDAKREQIREAEAIMAAITQDLQRLAAAVNAAGGSGSQASAEFAAKKQAAVGETITRSRYDLQWLEAQLKERQEAYFMAKRQLDDCNASCLDIVDRTNELTPPPLAPAAPPPPPRVECFGEACETEYGRCTETNSCRPIEDDCTSYGECIDERAMSDGAPFIDLPTNAGAWTTSINIEINSGIQDKLVDVLGGSNAPHYVVPPAAPQGVRTWFNPLGLLARSVIEQVERWRGSVGARPLILARDLELIDRVSNVQAAGLPKGVHVMLTDQGGSTGKTLVMQVLNLSGRPVRLSSRPFAVQPIRQQAQQQVTQAFARLSKAAPVRLDLNAYCVEFLKAPPGPNTLLRLAPANVQQKYASMSRVLQSAYRVSTGKALRPDSNPAAYGDAMKQWAIWTVEQKFNEQRFTEAFLGHTKKNVEAAGQKWSSQADDMIRKASPNRWRDIVKILRGAGVAVPQ